MVGDRIKIDNPESNWHDQVGFVKAVGCQEPFYFRVLFPGKVLPLAFGTNEVFLYHSPETDKA